MSISTCLILLLQKSNPPLYTTPTYNCNKDGNESQRFSVQMLLNSQQLTETTTFTFQKMSSSCHSPTENKRVNKPLHCDTFCLLHQTPRSCRPNSDSCGWNQSIDISKWFTSRHLLKSLNAHNFSVKILQPSSSSEN